MRIFLVFCASLCVLIGSEARSFKNVKTARSGEEEDIDYLGWYGACMKLRYDCEDGCQEFVDENLSEWCEEADGCWDNISCDYVVGFVEKWKNACAGLQKCVDEDDDCSDVLEVVEEEGYCEDMDAEECYEEISCDVFEEDEDEEPGSGSDDDIDYLGWYGACMVLQYDEEGREDFVQEHLTEWCEEAEGCWQAISCDWVVDFVDKWEEACGGLQACEDEECDDVLAVVASEGEWCEDMDAAECYEEISCEVFEENTKMAKLVKLNKIQKMKKAMKMKKMHKENTKALRGNKLLKTLTKAQQKKAALIKKKMMMKKLMEL